MDTIGSALACCHGVDELFAAVDAVSAGKHFRVVCLAVVPHGFDAAIASKGELWEASQDAGESWNVLFDGLYTKAGSNDETR